MPDFDRHRRVAVRCRLAVTFAAFCLAAPAAVAAQEQPPRRGLWDALRDISIGTYVEDNRRFVRGGTPLRDIDLATLRSQLTRFGIDIPFDMQGRVRGRVDVDVPIGALRQGRLYRAAGTIEAERIEIAGLVMTEVRANVDYRDGLMQLTSLQFRPPADVDGQQGHIAGTAALQLAPLEDLCGTVTLQQVALAPLVALFPDLEGFAAGLASGSVTFCVPAQRLTELEAWEGGGEVSAAPLRVGVVDIEEVAGNVTLREARLASPELIGRSYGAAVGGSGELLLQAPFPLTARLRGRTDQPERLAALAGPTVSAAVSAENASATTEISLQLSPFAISARGAAAVQQLDVAGVAVPAVISDFELDEQRLRLERMRASLPGGLMTGAGIVPFVEGPVELELDFAAFDLMDFLPEHAPVRIVGPASGRLVAQIPSDAWDDRRKWSADGVLSVPAIEVLTDATEPLRLEQFETRFQLVDGALRLPTFSARSGDLALTGSGRVAADAPYEFDATLAARPRDDLPPDATPLIHPQLRGHVQLAAQLRGAIQPFQLTADGQMTAAALEAGPLHIDRLRCDFQLDETHYALSNVDARLWDGSCRGSVRWPRDVDSGDADWELVLGEVQLNRIPPELLSTSPPLPTAASGRISGESRGHAPAGRVQDPFSWTAHVRVRADQLSAGAATIGAFDGEAELADRVMEYTGNGTLFSGRLQLRGRMTSPADSALVAEPPGGSLEWQSLALEQLIETLDIQPLVGLSGRTSFAATYEHDAAEWLSRVQGGITLEGLRWQGNVLGERFAGRLGWSRGRLTVRNLGGAYAGGRAVLAAQIPLDSLDRGSVSLILRNVDAGGALAPWTTAASQLAGRCDLRLQGTFRAGFSASGSLTANRMLYLPGGRTSASVELGTWRAPLWLRYEPRRNVTHVEIREASGQVAQGRVKGSARLTSGRQTAVSGQLEAMSLDLRELLRRFGATGTLGRGKASGSVTFASGRLNSLSDLAGVIHARFEDTEATAVPILRQLQPFLSPAMPSAARFSSGELRVRFGNDLFRVERLSLSGTAARIYATGTVTGSGRLNLDVTADTVNVGRSGYLENLLVQRFLLAAVPPAGLVLQANEFLANRIVHLSVGGTIRNPAIRVRPFESLGSEAVRFFVSRLLP